MAVTNTAIFPQAFAHDKCVCTAANTTYTATTNMVLLSTAGANGSEYPHISAIPQATNVLTNLQLFIYDGTTPYLVAMAVMAAQTLSTTTALAPVPLMHIDGTAITEANPLRLQSGYKLYAATGVANAGGIVFNAQRKDY